MEGITSVENFRGIIVPTKRVIVMEIAISMERRGTITKNPIFQRTVLIPI